MDALRIAIKASDGSTSGYWYMRKQASEYVLTFSQPKAGHALKKFASAEELSQGFYNSYIQYLGRCLQQTKVALSKLPTCEYNRSGFRRGWLHKQRQLLETLKAKMEKDIRTDCLAVLRQLQEKGWPLPTKTGSLDVTIKRAGAAGTEHVLSAATDDSCHSQTPEGILRLCPRDTEKIQCTNPNARVAWVLPSTIKVGSSADAGAGAIIKVGPTACAPGQTIQSDTREDKTNSCKAWDIFRQAIAAATKVSADANKAKGATNASDNERGQGQGEVRTVDCTVERGQDPSGNGRYPVSGSGQAAQAR